MNRIKIVFEGGQGEIVEKKSRFIANVKPVETEEEALQFIEATRKKYWDARHNCYAYVLGDRSELARCSDDGEPSQTAGKPMMEVLLGQELHNVVVVVTRYFGGTLLGTGGLVRAYTQATKAGIENSVVVEKIQGIPLVIRTDYNGLGKIQYLLGQRKIPILRADYGEAVELEALIEMTDFQTVKAEITEGTNGRARMEEKDPCYFVMVDGEALILS